MSQSPYSPKSILLRNTTTVVGNNVTGVVSEVFGITDPIHLRVDTRVSALVLDSATSTLKFQVSSDNGATWVDTKTANVTSTGLYTIKFLAEAAADQTYLPLPNLGRFVITNGDGAGDLTSATVDLILVFQKA